MFVLTVLHGSGIFGSAFTALWHGAIAFGMTGVVGSVVRPRRQAAGADGLVPAAASGGDKAGQAMLA